MAAKNPTLAQELRARNYRADQRLRGLTGMSFRAFKIIKAVTQLVGMIAGVYAISQGADPLSALGIMGLIWAGPEGIEVLLEAGGTINTDDGGGQDRGRDRGVLVMPTFGGQTRQRAKRLITKLLASPVLPVLGLTKCVETLVAGGPTLAWLGYSTLVTAIWVFADDIQQGLEELADEVDGE